MRHHLIGSAVAAGFVAAVLAIPSKEQQELKKLEKIRRALHPEVEKAGERLHRLRTF